MAKKPSPIKSINPKLNPLETQLSKAEKILAIKKEEAKHAEKVLNENQSLLDIVRELEKIEIKRAIKNKELTSQQKDNLKIARLKLQLAQEDIDIAEKQIKAVDDQIARVDALNARLKEQNEYNAKILLSTADLDAELNSVGSTLGKNSKVYAFIVQQQDTIRTNLQSISGITNQLGEDQVELKNQILAAADGQKKFFTVSVRIAKQLSEHNISSEEAADAMKMAREEAEGLVNAISTADPAGYGTAAANAFQNAAVSTNAFAKSLEKTKKHLGAMDLALDEITGHVPALSQLGSVIKGFAKKGKISTAALFALGAAVGALAFNLGFVGDKIGIVAKWDAKLAGLEGAHSVAKQLVELGQGAAGLQNFVSIKALHQFTMGLKTAAEQFKATAKTARFGEKIGPFGFDLAELNLAGISAESVSDKMSEIASTTGKVPTAEFATNMALVEKRVGSSVSQLVAGFMRTDKMSEKTALNMVEGIRASAKAANVDMGAVFKDLESSAEVMLDMGIANRDVMAQQVIHAQSLGLQMSKVASAGKNMVLNYKDSIKAEMTLSAMLGENVDLSEVRSRFAAGDNAGALEALRAQGFDTKNMDMFQLDALKQATGFDISELERINAGPGKTAENIKPIDAAQTAQDLLTEIKKNAQDLTVKNANIDAYGAIKLTQIDTDAQVQYHKAIEANILGLNDLAKAIAQAQFWKDLQTGFMTAIFALLGGGLTLLPKLFKGGGGLFGKSSKGVSAPASGVSGGIGKILGPKAFGAAGKGFSKILGPFAGLISAYQGFKDAGPEATTEKKVGSAAVQGGLALGGAALGTVLGGPIGTIIGGFVGDFLGSTLNKYAPGLSEQIGSVFTSVWTFIKPVFKPFIDMWGRLTEKFKPVKNMVQSAFAAISNTLNQLFESEGWKSFKKGFATIASIVTGFSWDMLLTPLRLLGGALEFLVDSISAQLNFFINWSKYGFSSAFKTLITDMASAISQLIGTIISPFKTLATRIWNFIVDNEVGKRLGFSPIKIEQDKKYIPSTNPQQSIGYPDKNEYIPDGMGSFFYNVAPQYQQKKEETVSVAPAVDTSQQTYPTAAELNYGTSYGNDTLMQKLDKLIEAISKDTIAVQLNVDGKTLSTANIRYLEDSKGNKSTPQSTSY